MFNLGKRWTIIVVYIFAFVLSLSGYVLAENLFDAAKAGSLEKVTQLIEEGANVNIRNDSGVTPLHIAAYRGDKDIADFLILKGADINSQTDAGDTPLMWAVKREKSDLVELIVQKGATVDLKDNKDRTPLAMACGLINDGRSTCFKCAEILIQNGADVNAAGDDGHTPLYWSTAAKDQNISEMLIKHGAQKR
jgi:ankyrin repeat protein